MKEIEKIIGLTIDDAKKLCSKYIFRVVQENGKYFVSTCDYREDRINLHVSNGTIIEASVG